MVLAGLGLELGENFMLLKYVDFPGISFQLCFQRQFTLTEFFLRFFADWTGVNDHERVQRQLSVSSDSKLLDDDIREETTRVIMRPKKPPRPKSEVFLNKQDQHPRRKRFSAFGVRKIKITKIGHLAGRLIKQHRRRMKGVGSWLPANKLELIKER